MCSSREGGGESLSLRSGPSSDNDSQLRPLGNLRTAALRIPQRGSRLRKLMLWKGGASHAISLVNEEEEEGEGPSHT